MCAILIGMSKTGIPGVSMIVVPTMAMIFGGNSHYAVEEIPGVNHLFQTAKTGAPSEYSRIEETIAPAVLEKIANWILQAVK